MIPFIAGILVSVLLGWSLPLWIALALLLPLLLLFFSSKTNLNKTLFLFFGDLFLFVYAGSLTAYKGYELPAHHYSRYCIKDSTAKLLLVINDLPDEREKTVKAEALVRAVDSAGTLKTSEGKMMVYFRRSPAAAELRAGEMIYVSSALTEIAGPMNPEEFNYRNFLFRKHVCHSLFLDSNQFIKVQTASGLNPLWQAGLDCKQTILQRLKNSSLDQTAYAICAALLTGYDEDIDRSVMQAFAHSGTLHVLSVSGLHTGIIYLVLNFLFGLVDRKNKYKISRFLIITFLLWLFALVAGFAAPVLRAVIMFNLLGLGKLFFRNTSSNNINLLLVSAFILLNYDPWLITDLGFLLSYFAMFGIFYFQPRLAALWTPENYFLSSIWISISASAGATISTLPITLFVFKQFPFWFFVCNLVVVPASFIVLFLAVLVVAKLNFAALLINWIIRFLLWFIDWFNKPVLGFVEGLNVDLADALFLSMFIVILTLAFSARTYRLCAAALFVLISWQVVSLFASWEKKRSNEFAVYQLRKNSVYSAKNADALRFHARNDHGFDYSVLPHFTSLNYPELQPGHFNFIKGKNEGVLILDSAGYWPEPIPEGLNTLVLCNNFRLYENDLKKLKDLRYLVLDGSNSRAACTKAEELCRNFGITFYSTRLQGAFVKEL